MRALQYIQHLTKPSYTRRVRRWVDIMKACGAHWAEASCIATLWGLSCRYASPLIFPPPARLFSGSWRWLYKIFSANVNGRLFKISRTSSNFFIKAGYGGVIEVQSFSAKGAWVARVRLDKTRHAAPLLMAAPTNMVEVKNAKRRELESRSFLQISEV